MTTVYAGNVPNEHSVFRFRRGKNSGFDKAYGFVVNNTVLISTHGDAGFKNGQNLRVSPEDATKADYKGAKGGFAQWETELEADKTQLRFKSNKNGKYLRIMNGNVDVQGGQGPYTLFKFHKTGQADNANEGRLQSVKEGSFLCVGPPKPFTKHYGFKHNNVVVLKHVAGKYLRVSPGDTDNLDGNGGLGTFAQWNAELNGDVVSFKSVKTGKYLRILPNESVNAGAAGNGPFTKFQVHKQGGGKVKLESKKLAGSYPAFRNDKVQKGTGGGFTVFEVFRQN